jgi:hypothetical protein
MTRHALAKSKAQNKIGKRQIAHLEPEVGKQLRQIAAEKGITAQALMGEALDYLSVKYGVAQPMKRLTIDVPADLYHRLSVACAQRQLKLTDLVRGLLAREFSRDQGAPIVSSGPRDVGAFIESSGQLETSHHEPIVGIGDFR